MAATWRPFLRWQRNSIASQEIDRRVVREVSRQGGRISGDTFDALCDEMTAAVNVLSEDELVAAHLNNAINPPADELESFERDELALLPEGVETEAQVLSTMRLGLDPERPNAEHRLIQYSIPYGAEPMPTVEQMWIERAMMHATPGQIALAAKKSVEWAESMIEEAVERMLARGLDLPRGAKIYIKL